jgi:hypothetical protein
VHARGIRLIQYVLHDNRPPADGYLVNGKGIHLGIDVPQRAKITRGLLMERGGHPGQFAHADLIGQGSQGDLNR